MPRLKTLYVCQQCDFKTPQYLGKCPECGAWSSMIETVEEVVSSSKSVTGTRRVTFDVNKVIKLSEVEKSEYERLSTKISEFDRVLGGGIVQGSVVLLAGDPGIGKSTLLSQLAINVDTQNKATTVLYVAGEESAQQIKLRVDRIQKGVNLQVLNEIDVDIINQAIVAIKPSLVIVDSIQTMETGDLTAAAGSVSQVRESAHRLQRVAKDNQIPMFIVGHVTKDGSIAGPRTLEHLVDVVLSLEGEQSGQFRILRAVKNRFGPTDEVGIFEMNETGMSEVINPSKLFIEQKISAPGSVAIVVLTGLRPMLLEVQALVTKTGIPVPRRVGTGIDNNRLQLLVAVLTKRLKLPLFDQDVFVNITGGMKVVEPAADLGICMAIVSSFKDIIIPNNMALVGEVGLLGEVREVRALDRRISEAKMLGFTNVISPKNAKNLNEVMRKLSSKEVNGS
jgi:DNA repair protein RadA/Sms